MSKIVDELALMTGIDIPFPAAQIVIHQPSIKEISYFGEEEFFIGCELLKFSKDSLPSEDKDNLKDQTNFDVIMSIMREKKDKSLVRNSLGAKMIFSLLFPDYTVQFKKNSIVLLKENEIIEKVNGQLKKTTQLEEHRIDNDNYEDFKAILIDIFCLSAGSGDNYNPAGDLAKKIADKLKKGNQKRAELEKQKMHFTVFGRYASILAIGLKIDLNVLNNYTVYQLYDQFKRYELKVSNDIHLKAQLAGAKNLEKVENWMKNIHED